MEVLQIKFPDGWEEDDKEAKAYICQTISNRKKYSIFKNLFQAIEEGFVGWEVKE